MCEPTRGLRGAIGRSLIEIRGDVCTELNRIVAEAKQDPLPEVSFACFSSWAGAGATATRLPSAKILRLAKSDRLLGHPAASDVRLSQYWPSEGCALSAGRGTPVWSNDAFLILYQGF